MSENSFKRLLTPYERMLMGFHTDGSLVLCYSLTINSSVPLTEYIFLEALEHLRRKTPNLRMVIKQDKDEVWFQEVERDVKFEFLESADLEDERGKMLQRNYDIYEGPLWSCRVIPGQTSDPCTDPEIKKKFPHQYNVLLGNSHFVTDGHSNMTIASNFLTILDSVLLGNPVDDEQIGVFLDGTELKEKMNRISAQLKFRMTNESKTISQILKEGNAKPLMRNYFPVPDGTIPLTLTVHRSLSSEDSLKLKNLCRKYKVTMNSAIMSLFDLAIHRMIREKGSDVSEEICGGHMVNMRRYGDWNKCLGLLNGSIVMRYDRKLLEDLATFWKHAARIQEIAEKWISEELTMKYLSVLSVEDEAESLMEEFFSAFSLEYISSNMGNLDVAYFTEPTSMVKITDLNRSASLSEIIPSKPTFHSLNGRLIFSVDYYTSAVSTDTMEQCVDHVFNGLEELFQLG